MSQPIASPPTAGAPDQATATESPPVVQSGPRGIGGWLILPAISVVLGPIVMAYMALQFAKYYARPNLSTGEFNYVTFEVAILCLMMILWVIAGILFFKCKRMFPKFFIGLLVLDGLGGLVSYNLQYGASETGSLIRGAMALAIWVPYMLVSERVRNTFVR